MNQLNEQEIKLHVQIVGWLMIASHALFLIIGAFVFLLLGIIGMGVSVRAPVASGILLIVATFVAMLLTLLGIPGVIAGAGLLLRWSWARILAIIVGALGLFNFPIGTLIGLYTLFVLLQDSAGSYFARPGTALQPNTPTQPGSNMPIGPS